MVLRSAAAGRDLDRIYDYLIESLLAFGDTPDEAQLRAELRLNRIHDAMERLGLAPFQGTLREDLMPGLRQVTKDQAIFYFTVDAEAEHVTVLAIFYGGQDHQRRMLRRLLGGE